MTKCTDWIKRTCIGVLFVFVACVAGVTETQAEQEVPLGFEEWSFLLGEWHLIETRYDFDGVLMQTNTGEASFDLVMNGQRIQEIQSLPRGEEMTSALHLFVYDPRSEEVEIARTDSGHFGFSVIIGSFRGDQINLVEKNPNPESSVTRRFTYRRIDDVRFRRQLEFSTDKGKNWFVRSEWNYTKK